jgi:hypothetical protein
VIVKLKSKVARTAGSAQGEPSFYTMPPLPMEEKRSSLSSQARQQAGETVPSVRQNLAADYLAHLQGGTGALARVGTPFNPMFSALAELYPPFRREPSPCGESSTLPLTPALQSSHILRVAASAPSSSALDLLLSEARLSSLAAPNLSFLERLPSSEASLSTFVPTGFLPAELGQYRLSSWNGDIALLYDYLNRQQLQRNTDNGCQKRPLSDRT